jgi:hypothetical protein
MYNVDYHRMMTIVDRADDGSLRLQQTLTVVMDAKRSRQGTITTTRTTWLLSNSLSPTLKCTSSQGNAPIGHRWISSSMRSCIVESHDGA